MSDMAVLWLFFAAVVGFYAATRNRSFVGWSIIALLISPLIAIVILAVVPQAEPAPLVTFPQRSLVGVDAGEALARLEELFERASVSAEEHERIKVLASRDRPSVPPAPVPAVPQGFTRPCTGCGRSVHQQATRCMHCWSTLPRLAA